MLRVSNRITRCCSFKPGQAMSFEKGKYLLLENYQMGSLSTLGSTGVVGLTGYFAHRIIRYHTEMSFLTFSLQSFLLLGLGLASVQFFKMNRVITTEISLFENGQEIQLKTVGMFWRPNVHKIMVTSIENPENNIATKASMKYFNSWVLVTGSMKFLIAPTSNIKDKDVLQSILKGIPIDTASKVSKDEVIDV